jgi:hypothetical protein
MRLQNVLDDPPKVHGGASGHYVLYKLADQVLRFIESQVSEQSITLETGAGISTILFALSHTEHICVVPDHGQSERIRAYCARNLIPIDRLRFEIGRSEEVLPRITLPKLDLVLIDGRHGFPTPFIDWYYTADALRIGGLLVIDDTQLWTGSVLKEFLMSEDEWRLEHDGFPRTAVFRKLAEGSHSKSWTEQPYFVRRSTLRRKNRFLRRARLAAELIRRGDFRTLLRRVFKGK